jgi:hypothetical protein
MDHNGFIQAALVLKSMPGQSGFGQPFVVLGERLQQQRNIF